MLKVQHLARLLIEFWNKTIKRGSAASHISEDDIVVFVVGPTGSGKSWFIKEATKCDLVKPSRDQHPSTEKVQAIRCELTDEAKMELKEGVKSIVFVDTPSFLTECNRFDARKEIEAWITQTKFQPQYAGVLYMHRVETDPEYEPIKNHLYELSTIRTIGDGCLRRLRFVVSYDKFSGNLSESKVAERRSKLCKQVDSWNHSHDPTWTSAVQEGLFQGEPDIAWKAVGELLRD